MWQEDNRFLGGAAKVARDVDIPTGARILPRPPRPERVVEAVPGRSALGFAGDPVAPSAWPSRSRLTDLSRGKDLVNNARALAVPKSIEARFQPIEVEVEARADRRAVQRLAGRPALPRGLRRRQTHGRAARRGLAGLLALVDRRRGRRRGPAGPHDTQ